MALPINILDLINGRAVESERIEYKKGWNPGPIYRSICAFANDFDDIGGGYIIVGIEEENGRPLLPPAGLSGEELDGIQREMIQMNNLINPAYHPKISVEEIQGKHILVIWAFAGDNRPYEVPAEIKAKDKKYYYYIRYGSSSVRVNKNQREELISQSGKTPYDDRPNTQVSFDEVSLTLVRDYLKKVESKLLASMETLSKEQLLSQMQLLYGPPERLHPRNVALMMFTENPEKYFPYSRVEIVHFPKGEADPEFFEAPYISGPVDYMINRTMDYLKINVLKQMTRKIKGQSESLRVWNYPYEAFEEVIANSLYHREYQTREPVEIRIYPEKVMVINYGGPDRSIKLTEFQKSSVFPRRYRNRRLGDFLKELDLTEGKATGIPTIRKVMKVNGSPMPDFITDEERSFFQVNVPIHPWFLEEIEKREIPPQIPPHIPPLIPPQSGDEPDTIPVTIGLPEKQKGIVQLIAKDPKVSVKTISEKLEINYYTAKEHVNTLKEKGVLERVGGTRGYWRLILSRPK
ncbi:RNA-binding domain-containing protein [Cyclobacterium amurskyense]|uniref:Putative transcriptional regulator n=1 Tax=Cyclobacterium amurskyense TaxID=320787 RepID=A0A0H4PCU0_9BACT|nr:RNA-binding domain-containing protein [Cyclobacterium amurskyense]AKP52281.1 Putative transcriptional regulator [Cyclobacterium amurskyense]